STYHHYLFFLLTIQQTPTSTLFPYTTLFRSDKNTRIRINLEKIIDLRNISTHFITEDYEAKYAPLFQACVLNFTNEINRFHEVRSEEHTSELQSRFDLVCRLLLEKKNI